MAVGLQTHIWNNNLRSIIFLALYPLIIIAMVWACVYVAGFALYGDNYLNAPAPAVFALNIMEQFWPTVVSVVGIWFLISYFFHTSMIRKLSRAHSITRSEEPELYNLLENLCIAQGMAMPKLNIIETHARNAFASGINEGSYTVTVTRGLLNSLQKDEVEAVLAHELTHIQNCDVRLMMITVIFTGMIGFAAQMMWNSVRYGYILSSGRGKNKGAGIIIILGIAVILWIGYMATLFMRFALSRSREYMADAGSIKLTKNPDAMMRALLRIADRAQIPETTDDIAMMCIENKKNFLGMFATHPPINQRIKAISEITGTPVPKLPHTGPASKKERFARNSETKNPWLIRQRGNRKRF